MNTNGWSFRLNSDNTCILIADLISYTIRRPISKIHFGEELAPCFDNTTACNVSNGTVHVSMCSHDRKNTGELVPRNMYQWRGLLHREDWCSPRRVMQRLGTTVCAREFRNISRSNRFQMTDCTGRWELFTFYKFSSFSSLSTMLLDFWLFDDGSCVISNWNKNYRFRVAIVT